MRKVHTQISKELNVWTGILDDRMVGPFFLEKNFDTTVRFISMCYRHIFPHIIYISEKDGKLDEKEQFLQQDTLLPH